MSTREEADQLAKAETLDGRQGHLPTIENPTDIFALGQLYSATVGCAYDTLESIQGIFLAATFRGESYRWDSSLVEDQLFVQPEDLSDLLLRAVDGDDKTRDCLLIQGQAYLASCFPFAGGMAISEFDLTERQGTYYREEPALASASGLVQYMGEQRGAFFAHLVMPQINEELEFLFQVAARGFYVSTLAGADYRIVDDDYFYFDGVSVPGNITTVNPVIATNSLGNEPVCVKIQLDTTDSRSVFSAETCISSFHVPVLAFKKQPIAFGIYSSGYASCSPMLQRNPIYVH